tara:strand:+ start:235 stop:441 length:207 start_codon:yes stop_codon:yes gene_type:complete
MDSTIAISVRNVYGEDKYYPANDQARSLASIAGTKTITMATMRLAADMGFTIKRIETNPADLDNLIAN